MLFAAVLVVSLYKALTVYFPQQQEQNRFSEYRRIVHRESDTEEKDTAGKYAPLMEYNRDFAGWLTIPDTSIDYPVVKPPEDDPEYYLHRDFDRNYSYSGTPFIGANCDTDSDIFIVYGHNMKTGSMFGTLDKYADAQWAAEHGDFVFDTADEHRVYRVFAVFRTKVNSRNEFRYFDSVGNYSDKDYERIISEFISKSEIETGETPQGKQQIILISTCSYHTENGRFAIAAYRVS